MRSTTRGVLLAFSMAAAFTSVPASAQSDEQRADARAAAMEGAAAFRDGRFAEAVDLFQRAESLVHAPPHLLYMARAHAALGKIVKAREIYQRVAHEHLAPDAPQAFERAQSDATTELAAVEARIPTVKVAVTGADGKVVVVTMDDVVVPSALIGISRSVDPGEHRFHAIGDGVESDLDTVNVAERSHETVELVLKPSPGAKLPAAAAPPIAATPATPAPSAQTPAAPTAVSAPSAVPRDEGETAGSSGSLRPVAYAALGVGVVGLGVGTVFALKSHSTKSSVESLCPGGSCPVSDHDQVLSLQDTANAQGRLAVVGFVLGGLGAAAGVTLLVIGGGHDAGQAGSRVGTRVGVWAGPGSLGARGQF